MGVILSACAVGPNFARPAPPKAERYTREPLEASTAPADGHAQTFELDAPLSAEWWKLFGSSQLDAAVRLALANNPTLLAAEASLRGSQDNLRAGYGVFYPHVGANMGISRERTAPLQQDLQAPNQTFNLVTLSGTVSYALDIFGGERRVVEGLRAQSDYQRYLTQAAYLALTANVVNTSIARAGYAAQVRTTEQLIDLQKLQLQLTDIQFCAGTIPYSNVLTVRGLISANQSLLAVLRQRITQTEDLLAALEGVTPSKATLPEIELTSIALPAALPISLPSDFVRQRPDILAAEAQLHVASSNIGVATAAMYPSISLSGTYGGASSSFRTLSAANGRFWSIGPSATVPIFQGGSLWFARKAAIDAFQESQSTYRLTVLSAFAQVADCLGAIEHDAEDLQAQVESRNTAKESLVLLQANYQAGLVAYPDDLAAEVQLHLATINYLQTLAQRQQDTVALFVALGGGWWNGKDRANDGGAP